MKLCKICGKLLEQKCYGNLCYEHYKQRYKKNYEKHYKTQKNKDTTHKRYLKNKHFIIEKQHIRQNYWNEQSDDEKLDNMMKYMKHLMEERK
jgi:hypothetical protein